MRACIRKDILRIKGCRYYETASALSAGELGRGAPIILCPEPENPHDKNAVKVLTRSDRMIGHISRNIAKKYQELCFQEMIHEVVIWSSQKVQDSAKYDIRIAVTYTVLGSRFRFNLPTSAGAYGISLGTGCLYIGATANLRRRYLQHVNLLLNESHPNKPLQEDFDRYGLEAFEFTLIQSTSSMSEAEEIEAEEIRSRVAAGKSVYNKTSDGKGIKNAFKYFSGDTPRAKHGNAPIDRNILDSFGDTDTKSVDQGDDERIAAIGVRDHEGEDNGGTPSSNSKVGSADVKPRTDRYKTAFFVCADCDYRFRVTLEDCEPLAACPSCFHMNKNPKFTGEAILNKPITAERAFVPKNEQSIPKNEQRDYKSKSDSSVVRRIPIRNEADQPSFQQLAAYQVQVTCRSCGEISIHDDAHLVSCPRCHKTIFLR